MNDSNAHYIILAPIVLLQLIVTIRCIWWGNKIRNIFSNVKGSYDLDYRDNNYYTVVNNGSADSIEICDEINAYLESYYSNNKSPDIGQIAAMSKDSSRVYDSTGSFIATVPILLGLAGTVLGLFTAFRNFDASNSTEGADFLKIISNSAAIAFLGTLAGITCTIFSNSYITSCKKQRDIRLNNFKAFLNARLSPKLATLEDETLKRVSASLHSFTSQHFAELDTYVGKFKEINHEISYLYRNGLKEVIERNSVNLEKMDVYISKLDNLKEATSNITLNPLMLSQFASTAAILVNTLNASSQEQKATTGFLNEILLAYKHLENRIHDNVINLTADRQLFGDFKKAIDIFMDTSSSRLEAFNTFSKLFDEKLQKLSSDYTYSFNTLKDGLAEKIGNNFNPANYQDFAKTIESIEATIKTESENIKALANSLTELTAKMNDTVAPALTRASQSINNTSDFLRGGLPKALTDTVEANKKMVITTSQKLLDEPKVGANGLLKGQKGYLHANDNNLFIMDNDNQNDYFWPAYVDFMVVLFFIALGIGGYMFITYKKKIEGLKRYQTLVTQVISINESLKTEFKKNNLEIDFSEKNKIKLAAGVLFEKDSFNLKPDGLVNIASIGNTFKKVLDKDSNFSKYSIMVEGHTDSDGDAEHNDKLSFLRAKAITNAWALHCDFKLPKYEVISSGFGALKPVKENTTLDNKAANRRIEISIIPRFSEFIKLMQSTQPSAGN